MIARWRGDPTAWGVVVAVIALVVSGWAVVQSNRAAHASLLLSRQSLAYEQCVETHKAQREFALAQEKYLVEGANGHTEEVLRASSRELLSELVLLEPITRNLNIINAGGHKVADILENAIGEAKELTFLEPTLNAEFSGVREKFVGLNWLPDACTSIIRTQ